MRWFCCAQLSLPPPAEAIAGRRPPSTANRLLVIVKWRAARQHDQENAAAFVILFVEIVSDDVVNAVDATIGGNALTLGGMRIRDLEDATDVADPVVPKRNVIDAADRTVARLAARA